jgi:translation initiation factor 2 beta subunit (eIF-2beta)/eIF-5
MSLLSGNTINMDGSADPGYRYTMPALVVKHEGSNKMKKSIIVNLSVVSRAVGRPAEHLLTYLGHSLSAANKVEKEKAYIAGHHDLKLLQQQVVSFVRDFVMCEHCNNPETSCGLEGSKKNKAVFLSCKSCGRRTYLDSTNRFVKHMAQHLPADTVQGHAQPAGNKASLATAIVAELADAEQAEDDKSEQKKRYKCPNPQCRHKTSKATCSKCGTDMVKDDDHFGAGGDGCRACIQQWMQDRKRGSLYSELLVDFESTMKSFDFRMPAAVQLAAVIEIMAADIIAECDIKAPKLQPVMVSEKASPSVKEWGSLIGYLRSEIGDTPESINIMISTLKKAVVGIPASDNTKESLVIGFLLSLRDLVDVISDEDILAGCRRLQSPSNAMEKFIEFLESSDADDDSGAE